jgi:hypothetical protein
MPDDKFTEAQQRSLERLLGQADGTARRAYSAGQLGPDDEGDLALAIGADLEKRVVMIHFGKPVRWVGLGEDETLEMIRTLIKHLRTIATRPFTIEVP